MVGHILRRGESGLTDADEAVRWYRRAAQNEQADALVALGEMALRAQGGLSPSDALDWLTRAANLGRTDAMRVLADMYKTGKGVVPNFDTSTYWLGQAAQGGDGLAARHMGDLFLDSDAPEALKWYEKAAAQGDPQSAYIAALMYAENFDIRPNETKAAVLMRQAAEGNIPAAQADYGLLVYQGAGVEPDAKRAAYWFERAATGGDREGQFLYAFTLAKGEGVEQSFEEAYYWLLKSGNSGIDEYDQDREILKSRLEDNVDPAILDKARQRFTRENDTEN